MMVRYNKHILITVAIVIIGTLLLEVTMLILLASQVGRYSAYWQQQIGQSPQANELIYVALGDSVGLAIGATSAQRGYVGLMAQALQSKTGRKVHVINLSTSGARIKDGLEKQLPVLKVYKPEVVTIELGANDVARNWNEADFRRDMEQLMDALPRNTIISDLPYFGGGLKRSVEKHVLAANKIIHELAIERSLVVAPLHEEMKTHDSLRIYAADYFHPSNYGHQHWFQAFWQAYLKD